MPWGWLKRGTGPGLMSMVPETKLGTKMVTHHDVPRFRALRRDKTLTPAELTISNNSGYNECSLSCLRGRRRGPLVTTLSSLSLVGGSAITVVPSSLTGRNTVGSYRPNPGYKGKYTLEVPAVSLRSAGALGP